MFISLAKNYNYTFEIVTVTVS